MQIFKAYELKINKKTELDLMFIMDCTGSMAPWIQASKEELFNIIDFVRNQYPDTQFRVSFVGYRDHSNEPKDQFCIQDFTEDLDKIKVFIQQNAKALSNNDGAEDVAGGLEKALQQNWKSAAKYCILITDAPCHGAKYHDDYDDYFLQGDPKGRIPEKQIQEFAKLNIQFFAIKITQLTNRMFNILSQSYQEIAQKPITIANLGKSTQSFGFFIACTVSATLGATVLGTQVSYFGRALDMLNQMRNDENESQYQGKSVQQQEEFKQQLQSIIQQEFDQIQKEGISLVQQQKQQEKQIIKFDLMSNEPNWPKLQDSTTYEAIGRTFFIVKDKDVNINWKKPLIQNSEIQTQITICNNPFSQGAMRYAFYANDNILNQKLVAKLPKWIDDKYNLDSMKNDLESIFICQHIVNDFNDRIVQYLPDTRLLLNFVHCFIYEIKDQKTPYKYYYTENFIEGQYEKYNNNAGWFNNNVNESSLISQAFSHFSWQLTEGFLMIVDLQGVTGILTDPQIHCLNIKRFGLGNKGYGGMLIFFAKHICNNYCKMLNLIHPKDKQLLPNDFTFFSRKLNMPNDPKSLKQTLCDLCRNPYILKAEILYNKFINSQEKYCQNCDIKRKQSMKQGQCIDCGNKFTSSAYWFMMKRTDFPVRCGECRRLRREKMRIELENQK